MEALICTIVWLEGGKKRESFFTIFDIVLSVARVLQNLIALHCGFNTLKMYLVLQALTMSSLSEPTEM